jgi:hypothetical protein
MVVDGPNWEEDGQYAALLHADRLVFAWEWLRRNQAYRLAAASPSPTAAEAWGLHRLVDPALAAPEARPMWTAQATRHVVRCHALADCRDGEALDFAKLAGLATVECGTRGEHLLISNGIRAVRLDVMSGTVMRGPVMLRYEISGITSAGAQLFALRRFLAVVKSGSFSAMLHRPERRAWRWIRELRAFDALAKGATQREIATGLIACQSGEAGWRVQSPSLRLQSQRLVRRARYMAGEGYRDLLQPATGPQW